jgi:hypothetical protein
VLPVLHSAGLAQLDGQTGAACSMAPVQAMAW